MSDVPVRDSVNFPATAHTHRLSRTASVPPHWVNSPAVSFL
ncbi:hypothetical protein [Streptomyces sp. NPDC060322]